MLNIILMGPPGAGKGTQATQIEDTFHLPHISTGDMFREAIAKGTELGKKAKAIIEQGGLVPDEITIGLVRERLSQQDCANGYLLDGFPRTLPQAEALTKMGPEIGRAPSLVVDINVPDEELTKRIAGRRVCPSCGASYNVHFLPPKEEGVCDRCHSSLIQRKDDNEASFAVRLSNYHQQTAPLIQYYEGEGIYHGFNGTSTPEELFKKIKSLLEENK